MSAPENIKDNVKENAKVKRIAKCPQCRKSAVYDGNTYRPFCSERCKMIDLGHWAAGDYAVAGEKVDLEAEDRNSESESGF